MLQNRLTVSGITDENILQPTGDILCLTTEMLSIQHTMAYILARALDSMGPVDSSICIQRVVSNLQAKISMPVVAEIENNLPRMLGPENLDCILSTLLIWYLTNKQKPVPQFCQSVRIQASHHMNTKDSRILLTIYGLPHGLLQMARVP